MKTKDFSKHKLTTTTKELAKQLRKEKNIFLTGSGGCVDGDTEFLSIDGWKRIADYKKTEVVAEWYKDGTTKFITPLAYTKNPCEYLTKVKTKTFEMIISNNHRVVTITNKENIIIKEWQILKCKIAINIPRYFRHPYKVQESKMCKDYHTIELQSNETIIETYKTLDGYEYCFTTPSTMWLARKNGVIFVTGNSGKTHLVRDLLKEFKKPLVLGSTNQSTQIQGLKGQTVHTFFKLFDTRTLQQQQARVQTKLELLSNKYPHLTQNQLEEVYYKKEIDVLAQVDLIVVEEISCLGKKTFNLMYKQLEKLMEEEDYYNIPILLVGDYFQLQPVNDNFAFESSYFHDYKIIELGEIKRTNSKNFAKVQGEIRQGVVTEYGREMLNFFQLQYQEHNKDELEDKAMFLYPTNKDVQEHNSKMLEKLDETENLTQESEITFRHKDITNYDIEQFYLNSQFEENFKFKIGARIVFIATLLQKEIYNGLQGVIIGVSKDKGLNYIVKIKTESNKLVEVGLYPFQHIIYKKMNSGRLKAEKVLEVSQLPLKSAYAISIHKSQGLTINSKLVIDCSKIFTNHQFYVAMSRCSNPKLLYIKNLNPYRHIKVHPKVKKFYKGAEIEKWIGY